ncbi:hypothetical protein DTW90_31310 [Neorhizobium sp. P12A]|uniref:hypothetical protein n=1 Tax=Neorhizobium sp. P12A TaxID=2268027 RepID=UPI0011EEF4CB|nr:hypothetical protein [Neorhizobium sp. P12A]KAA0689401.1 hypothetical protein DTW90_31310 [Neorhizobium sp. P12A]
MNGGEKENAAVSGPAIEDAALNNEPTTRSSEIATEDQSCYDVNRAYESFHSSDSFVSKIYEVAPNANPRLHLEWQMIDRNSFIKIEHGLWKRSFPVPVQTAIDGKTGRPVFTACRLQDSEDLHGEPTLRYSAHWERNGWMASINIWVSKASGKLVQAVSQYEQGHCEFDFPVALETISYDRNLVLDAEAP